MTSEERYRIEKIVHGEEGMYKEGCYLIAQCIRDAIVYNHAEIMKLHLSSSQGGMGYEGYYTTEEPGDWAKEAVIGRLLFRVARNPAFHFAVQNHEIF